MEYTVIIRKEHCLNVEYIDCNNCALCNAIREQLPDFKFSSVSSHYVRVGMYDYWDFKENTFAEGWGAHIFNKMVSGEIESYPVTFRSPNHYKELSEANVIEVNKIINTGLEVI